MINRKKIMQDCPEDFEDNLTEIIDEIERMVNDALQKLDEIKDISDLCNIEECQDILKEISQALY